MSELPWYTFAKWRYIFSGRQLDTIVEDQEPLEINVTTTTTVTVTTAAPSQQPHPYAYGVLVAAPLSTQPIRRPGLVEAIRWQEIQADSPLVLGPKGRKNRMTTKMAFILRRPFAITNTLKQAPRFSQITFRSFQTQSAPLKQAITHARPSKAFANKESAFLQAFRQSSRRNYQTSAPANPLAQGNLTQRLIYGGAIFGGTLLAINLIFNRETREDGGMPSYERSYLNDTFLHTGLGIGIIGITARALHMNGWSYRLMSASPWLVLIGGLGASIGSMMVCYNTAPENYMVKYGSWAAFNVAQAALLSPLLFFSPAILARAGLYTVGMMGSIALVGATAKQDKYLYLGGPLLAGVAIVALSGLAPLVIPATAARTLMWTENIWLYGGLAVFGGFTLYDIQKILNHARAAERGMMKRDAVNESISLELDFINIFIRMVQLLAMQQGRRKR